MDDEAPLLSIQLLSELEACWKRQHAPIADNLSPGLSEDEIDRLTPSLGPRLPVEARVWWGWHDGVESPGYGHPAPQRQVGPLFEYLPLREAVGLYQRPRELSAALEGSEPLDPPHQFPITSSAGTVRCDCSVPEGAPTPIYHVHSHDYDIDGVTNPRTRSFGEMVRWWIEALEDGTWTWDMSAGRWQYDPSRLDAGRAASGLV